MAILAAAGGFVGLSFRARARNVELARRLDSFMLGIPMVRIFLRVSFGLNFSFAMETLLTSGYPLEEALEESSWVVGNLRYRDGLLRVRDLVVKGVRHEPRR